MALPAFAQRGQSAQHHPGAPPSLSIVRHVLGHRRLTAADAACSPGQTVVVYKAGVLVELFNHPAIWTCSRFRAGLRPYRSQPPCTRQSSPPTSSVGLLSPPLQPTVPTECAVDQSAVMSAGSANAVAIAFHGSLSRYTYSTCRYLPNYEPISVGGIGGSRWIAAGTAQ